MARVVPASFVMVLLLATVLAVAADEDEKDLQQTLAEVAELVQQHRFMQVIEQLEPFDNDKEATREDAEAEYAITAELGRAYFHLGRYVQAHRYFGRAVRLAPERPETALYLLATSYLTGRREQAFAIFRELVKSGARDLHLAVTLPGEREFLTETRVWQIVEEFQQPVEVDLDAGVVRGIRLGDQRDVVASALGAGVADASQPVLEARAGPRRIWLFRFDQQGELEQVMINAEHLLKYTPFRLSFGQDLDWRLSPAQAIALLGAPDITVSHNRDGNDQGMDLTWDRPGSRLTLQFGVPQPPRPLPIAEGVAMLRLIILERTEVEERGRAR